MAEFNDDSIADPVWNALRTTQQHLGLHGGQAVKYRADVAPFAAIASNTAAAMADLRSLMAPGEATYLLGEPPPEVPELRYQKPIGVLQMLFPLGAALPLAESAKPEESAIQQLSCDDAQAMVELTSVAFPGFFREQTCEMGQYYGIWSEGKLVAMGGERMVFNPYREISGVCTHPDHRGKAYAARIITQILRDHRRDDHISWLHVASNNRTATQLYERLGFKTLREVQVSRVTRANPPKPL